MSFYTLVSQKKCTSLVSPFSLNGHLIGSFEWKEGKDKIPDFPHTWQKIHFQGFEYMQRNIGNYYYEQILPQDFLCTFAISNQPMEKVYEQSQIRGSF